ncbi:MAG: hypothetical protein ABI893_01065 [Polaromonas sp.]|uniref:hypothetical protein n=1 Tax=Polaromonas sp. TaxID=1869339 RepID=UPI0032639872
MKKLIASLFGSPSPAASSKRPGSSSRDNPLTIEDGSDNATRRQLVQVLLRDAMRKYGIPPRWIDCQMLLVSSRSRGPGMYVRLVVRQWDDRLMKYAFAFQNALMAEITHFEPGATQWLHGISWQLDVADTCPNPTMPDKTFWADPVRPPAARPSRAAPLSPTPATAAAAVGAATAPASAATTAAPAAPSQPAPMAMQASPTVPDPEAMKDLERLFRIRDQELGPSEGNVAAGYEPTRPSPL